MSLGVGAVGRLKRNTDFKNVDGSSDDPKFDGAWIDVWRRYTRSGNINCCCVLGCNCCDGEQIIGGHIVLGKNVLYEEADLENTNKVFLLPLCKYHNNQNEGMTAKKGTPIVQLIMFMQDIYDQETVNSVEIYDESEHRQFAYERYMAQQELYERNKKNIDLRDRYFIEVLAQGCAVTSWGSGESIGSTSAYGSTVSRAEYYMEVRPNPTQTKWFGF